MAKTTFDDDPDVQAMRASMRPTAAPMRWGRVLTGILVVACATFAFAYHLPLQRAHATLSERFTELQGLLASANRTVEESRKQAAALLEQQQAAAAQAEQAKRSDHSRAEVNQSTKAALEAKLQKPIAKNQAAVARLGAQTVTSLSLDHLLSPGKLELSAQGKVTLCSVAAASNERPVRVLAIADKKSIPARLAPKLKTPLQYSLALAQLVTETLLEKCNMPAARLSATGFAAEPPASAALEGKKVAGARIELWWE